MNSQNIDDPKILMKMAKEGDSGAFGRLYEMFFSPIYRYVYLRVRSRGDAEDLTQIIFLKVFQSVSDFEEKGKNPVSYFYAVARNAVIDYWRKKKEVNAGDTEEIFENIPSPKENIEKSIDENEIVATIRQAIKSLTDEQQEVIVLKFINDLSNKEIAELLGKNETAIRQLQCRGLKKLREVMSNEK